ncbi:MFS transporter ['Paenibacillus yunnanensis' Narsing Rao et al. 2020]|uniref:MFS transporter n=1 Tax=Paenibacillus tengchongensis TaxID=2608684 RepID=UPI00124C6A80|nr:MFS transporter [Paenibacillus tengchongensis]
MIPAASSKRKSQSPLGRFAEPFARSKAFPYLWLGHIISFLGSSVTMVILPVLVYSLTGSTATMGMVMAVYMLPNVIMLPISGYIVDRYDRVKIMITADVARFAVMGAIAALALSGVLTIPMLYVLVGLYGLFDGLFRPAYSAVQASVFTPEIRVAANSLSQMSIQTIRLIGPSLGGLLVTHLSAGFGFGLDALTYLLSLVCLIYLRKALLSATQPQSPAPPVPDTASTDWKADFKEGIAVLRSHPWLWITILAFCFVNICYSGVSSILLPWLFKVHHGWDSYVYGLAVTFSGVGAILAGLLYGMRKQWRKRGLMAYGGALVSGVALLLLPFAPGPASAVALFALEGFGLMIFGLIWEISLQDLVPKEAFGRVASLDLFGSFALLPVGYIVVGWLADWIGGVATIAIFSSLGIACIALVLCVPAIRKFQ